VIAVLAFVLWPDRGLWSRWQKGRKLTERALREDAAKHIHKRELSGRHASMESLAGVLQITLDEVAELLTEMESHGLLNTQGGKFQLTPKGQSFALHVIRAHRLWERYLADETGLPETEWHSRAELSEHRFTPAELDELSEQLGNPLHDPHGDPIPTSDGHVVPHGGTPLTEAKPGSLVRIVHVEDEPEAVYKQLIAEGLYPNMTGRITEMTPQRLSFWAEGEEHLLAPIVARNISVLPVPEEEISEPETRERLSSLKTGEQAKVVSISRACRASERRRVLDLGVLPGTIITAEMSSPGGDPTAYRIREALIALRRDQADSIYVTRDLEKTA
jgi:DtxR family Mn-dependent transcriptional regulator